MNALVQAHEWLAKNGEEADKHAGKWVAVMDDKGIVASASTVVKLQKILKLPKGQRALITKIPTPDEIYSLY